MYFWDECGKRVKYELGENIGGGQYGTIHRLPDDECIKVYKKDQVVDDEIIKAIRDLRLKNFYEIYKILYGRTGKVKAHTMRYYETSGIDILSMPIEYTLRNLYDLYSSFMKLTENNIYASDVHTGNIILGLSDITILDVDIYTFNKVFSQTKLRHKNIGALRCLFQELFLEALKKFHPEIDDYSTRQAINTCFGPPTTLNIETIQTRLSRDKYPIDYITKQRKKQKIN